jgi:hypothetical protein
VGVVSTIVALIKAVPVLERLFLGVAKAYREQVAKNRLDEKLSFIDDIVDLHSGVSNPDAKAGKRKKAGGSPRVPRRRSSGTGVHKGGSKNGGRARVRTGKKVNSLKRKRR